MKKIHCIKRMFTVFTAVTLAAFLLPPVSFSQVGSSPASQMDTAVSKVSDTAAVEEPFKGALPKSGNVTVNFKDVDIVTVLQYLSEVSGVDIIPSPGVDAKVTMRLRDKPWEVALDIVTRNYGYVHSREGDIVRVIPKGQLQAEEPVTTVIILNHIITEIELETGDSATLEEVELKEQKETISQLMAAIGSILDTAVGERATYVSGSNAIVVTAIPAHISAIKEMVAQLDKKTPQIFLDCKVIKILLSKDERFGVDWNAVITASGARRPTTVPFTTDGVFQFLPGYQRMYYPTTTSNVQTSTIGSGGAVSTTNTISPLASTFPQASTEQGIDTLSAAVSNSIFSYGTLDFSAFTATLSLLDKRGDTETLSSPRITTLNNQKATIKVVKKIMFQKTQETTQTAGIVTVSFEREADAREVGVKLTIMPHVNSEKEITVNLMPEVSSGASFPTITVGTNQTASVAFQYDTREANTRVRVKDGETIFIGGLINEEVKKTENKLPIIGDIAGGIPLVGNLFKYEAENVERSEIVFFVTVRILKSGKDSIKDSESTPQYEKYYVKKEEGSTPETETEEEERIGSVIKTGEVESKKEKISVRPLPSEKTKKKAHKAFLDFRKKKEKEKAGE